MLNEHLPSSLRARFPVQRLDAAANFLVTAAALVAFVLLASSYFDLLWLPVYGHDEPHYYEYYNFALNDDGRWLNYLLHGFLRRVPLQLWALLYLVIGWALLYRLARLCTFDVPLAALVASTILVSSPFAEISIWPASFVPALALVWFALWMQARGLPYQVVYLVSGILIFGSIQTLYFVLPLLFVQQFLDTSQPAPARALLLFKHMLWWVGGSLAGLLVLCVMLWFLAGIYFPQPAAWRNAHPVVDGTTLLANIRFVSDNLSTLLEQFLRNGGVTWGFILTGAAVALLRARTLIAQAPALLLLAAVLISFFLFCIPLAPLIHMRSLIAMAAAVVLGLALLPGQSAPGRILAAVLLLKLAHNYSWRAQDYLELQRTETAVLLGTLERLIPGYPWAYSAVVLDGTVAQARPEARRFNDSSLMDPILKSLGVITVLDCRIPARCDKVSMEGEPVSALPFAAGQLELSVNATNAAIIRYRATNSQAQ
jgi:hypothetical protein